MITGEKWKFTPRGLLAIPDGVIAVVGEVPDAKRAMGVKYQIGLSTDQGKTWHTGDVPLDVFGRLSAGRDGSLVAIGKLLPKDGLAKDDHWITLSDTVYSTRDGVEWTDSKAFFEAPKVVEKKPVAGGTIFVLQMPGFLDPGGFHAMMVRSLRDEPRVLASASKQPRISVLDDGNIVEVYEKKTEWVMPGPHEVDAGEKRLVRFNIRANQIESP